MPAKFAPSLLAADFAYLAAQVEAVEQFADSLHIDMMDGHFVPTLGIGPQVVESLRPITNVFFHCHLMIENPMQQFEVLAKAGANLVTVHVEAVEDPVKVVASLRELGVQAGLALNPETPADAVFPYLDELGDVIVMTVNPGWGGQAFLPEALPKVEAVRAEIDRRGLDCDVEVDGGINEETGRRCVAAGATVISAGSSVFRTDNPMAAARRLAAVAHGDEGSTG
jgi:ribulose-phosphate 3-epimerase